MSLSHKVVLAFLFLILLYSVNTIINIRLNSSVNSLQEVDIKKLVTIQNIERNLWQTLHYANSYRLTSKYQYLKLIDYHSEQATELYTEYLMQASPVEQEIAERFNRHWQEIRENIASLTTISAKKLRLSREMFQLIDDADDVIDYHLQGNWKKHHENNIEKEQSVREVEVSLWETIHALTEYLDVDNTIIRSDRNILGSERVEGAEASYTQGDFRDLMERQIIDVNTYWARFTTLSNHPYERTAINLFNDLWSQAEPLALALVELHDSSITLADNISESTNEAHLIINQEIESQLRSDVSSKQQQASFLSIVSVSATAIAILITCLFAFGFYRMIIVRINQLKLATLEVANDNFDCSIDVSGKDELSALGNSFNDMTEKLSIHRQALLDKNCELVRTNKYKSEFLACMSHELRTPMNGVLGILNILQQKAHNTEYEHQLNIAHSSAKSLLRILNDILDFSKIEANKLELEEIEFSLIELFDQTFEELSFSSTKKDVQILFYYHPSLSAHVVGDPIRTQQVLRNLLGNAIKFTHQGLIKITPKLEITDNNEAVLECEISDTGPGISPDKLDSIFKSFQQEDSSTTRKFGGTGLGLSITKKLCQLMQGDVRVDSVLNEGSKFTFNCAFTLSSHSTITNVHAPAFFKDKSFLLLASRSEGQEALLTCLQNSADTVIFNELDHSTDISPLFEDVDYVVISHEKDDNSEQIDKHLNYYATKAHCIVILVTNDSGKAQSFKNEQTIVTKHPITPKKLHHIINSHLKTITSLDSDKQITREPTLYKGAQKNLTLPQQKSHVLVVEDNRVNQKIINYMLQDMGFSFSITPNGKEAISTLGKAQPDQFQIILMDCQMPEMDRYEATARIRSGKAGACYSDIPIIALTANALSGDKQKCLDSGMNDYLTKPIELESLTNVFQKWL